MYLVKDYRYVHFNSRPSARGDKRCYMANMAWIFQFTPLREGRHCWKLEKRLPMHFNSRPSARGDDTARGWGRKRWKFQFTPLREGRRRICTLRGHLLHFNSRPSARGDGKRYAISANLLFNPYKSAWLNNRATQFVEIILVIFHRIIA